VNDRYWVDKYENVCVVKYKPFNILDFVGFYFYIKRRTWQIFHSTSYSGLLLKIPGRITIITVHDLTYKLIKNYFSESRFLNELAKVVFDFIVDNSIKNANVIIAVSKTTSQDVMRIYRRVSLIVPEGINLLPQTTIALSDFKRLGLERKRYFLYVGNLRKNKNIPFMINCFIKSNSPHKLVIAGSNSQVDIDKNPKASNVQFIGYVTDEELKELYQNCIAFVFPSTYEGFGLPVLEALNNGAAVLCSNGGALREFSSTIVNFFDPHNPDSLIKLFKQESFEVDRMLILKELNRYNWVTNFKKMHHDIEEIITLNREQRSDIVLTNGVHK
jgi:glycosyltransferase involved in cell wall biosynthesis